MEECKFSFKLHYERERTGGSASWQAGESLLISTCINVFRFVILITCSVLFVCDQNCDIGNLGLEIMSVNPF